MDAIQIRGLLKIRRVKPDDIAREVGCSTVAVYRVIKGDMVSKRIREAIAKAIGRPVYMIWGEPR